MTLLEFINDTLQKNNIQGDAKQIEQMITDIAEQRAVDGKCAISDSEVEQMIINNAQLSTQLAKEKAKREAKEEAERKALEEQREKEKAEKLAQKEKERAERKAQREKEKAELKAKKEQEKEQAKLEAIRKLHDENKQQALF